MQHLMARPFKSIHLYDLLHVKSKGLEFGSRSIGNIQTRKLSEHSPFVGHIINNVPDRAYVRNLLECVVVPDLLVHRTS